MARKITYLTTGLGRGGAEIQLMLLCRRFVEAGWEVRLISLLPPLDFEEELDQLGVPFACLNVRKNIPDPRLFWKLVMILREWRPDILHCHQVHANLLGRLARIFTSIPAVVCTAHSIHEGPRWREWAYSITDPLCELTTNVCRAGVERYVQIGAAPAGKIHYIPNAVDLNNAESDPGRRASKRKSLGAGDEFVWLAVGNPREAKAYPNMLSAFERVGNHDPSARLWIAGTGPLSASLEADAARRGLNRIRFLGARNDISELLEAADGFLMSSSWEGTPLALLEACAAGLPVVATRVGGIPEIVADGECGFLAEPGNPGALAEACLRVMNSPPEMRRQLGAAGRAVVQKTFGSDAVTEQWRQVYQGLSRGAAKDTWRRSAA